MTRRRQWSARTSAAAVAVLVLAELALTAGATRWALTTRYRTPPPVGQVPAVMLAGARDSAPPPRASARPRVGDWQEGAPLHLQVPRLSISARVVAVSADAHGALLVPSDVAEVGWWRDGAVPGSGVGTAVIAGHVDSASQGRGALFALSQVRPGDRITLRTVHGEVRYTAVARRSYAKAELPADVFATRGRPRLVLITCGGRFDPRTRHYASNVVVYAVPTA